LEALLCRSGVNVSRGSLGLFGGRGKAFAVSFHRRAKIGGN
jgi:hypothetical protein